MSDIDRATLLEGALAAFEQCSRLLEDAVILIEHERYSTAAGVALFAREELGRHNILLDFFRRGTLVTVDDVDRATVEHVAKQAEAQGGFVFRGMRGTQLGDLLHAQLVSPRGTPERDKAGEQLEFITQRKRRRDAEERHNTRMSAFYVDAFRNGSGWSLPKQMVPLTCAQIVNDALDCYNQGRDALINAGSVNDDHDVAAALVAFAIPFKPPPPRQIPWEIMSALLTVPSTVPNAADE